MRLDSAHAWNLRTERPVLRGTLLVIGLTGLVVSIAWILIGMRIEWIEKQ